MSAKYLLNVTITPVQEYIAEARKTRDLWLGSYILSFITFKALEPFIRNSACDVIYPDYKKSPFCKKSISDEDLQVASLPNHFLVIVPENDLERLVIESKNKLESYWNEEARKVKDHIKNQFNYINSDWDFLWDGQIKNHWQYMWVTISVSKDDLDNNYVKKAQEIQRFLECCSRAI